MMGWRRVGAQGFKVPALLRQYSGPVYIDVSLCSVAMHTFTNYHLNDRDAILALWNIVYGQGLHSSTCYQLDESTTRRGTGYERSLNTSNGNFRRNVEQRKRGMDTY